MGESFLGDSWGGISMLRLVPCINCQVLVTVPQRFDFYSLGPRILLAEQGGGNSVAEE